MIEQALYFALGFSVAGLLALGLAPAVWARALRLTRRRLELMTPMDAREAAADRDHVRAEAALRLRRAEQEIASERARRGAAMAEIGRKAAAIAALEKRRDLLDERLADTRADLARAEADRRDALAEQGAYALAAYAEEGLRKRKEDERAALAQDYETLSAVSESRRIAVVALETRMASDRAALDAVNEAADRLREALEQRTREAAALIDERAFLREEIARAEAGRQQLAARHAAATERLTQAETELIAARDATRRAESEAQRAREAAERAAMSADDVQDALEAARARLAEQTALAHERERALADRLEAERADAAALRGALDQARRAASVSQDAYAGHDAYAGREASAGRDAEADHGSNAGRARKGGHDGTSRAGDAALRDLIVEVGRRALGEAPPAVPRRDDAGLPH